ncbi:MAG: hypothetical protein QMD21_04220 [Candidatus Thermoplasmatota archaeon]|nr:hypothetical protein [Candidatus Thermoplasmatota archaeon]
MALEQEIFELWKELHPTSAFTQGLDEYGGDLFIPTKSNKAKILAEIAKVRKRCKTKLHKKFLNYLETELLFEEPEKAPDKILWAFFGILAKKGLHNEYLGKLAENSLKLIEANEELGYKWPIEIKILSYKACKGLIGILKSIKAQVKDKNLEVKISELENKVKSYAKHFSVPGLNKGDFTEIYPILKKHGKELGRKKIYGRLLKDLYDYYETTKEIESKAMQWLKKELPQLKKITKELAKIYKIKPKVEKVAEELSKRAKIARKEVLELLQDLRKNLIKIVERELVKISPVYNTKVMTTPNYLVPFIPSGAMNSYDTLTTRPFCIFFVTTDEKFAPPTSLADLLQLLVHEEYGHCVNFTNSAVEFAGKISILEKLATEFRRPITEGISFHRELEALQLLKSISRKKELSADEKELIKRLKKMSDLELLLKEIEFVVYEWRIIRFLRAISDVRINTGKQGIAEFIDWAHKYTGLSKRTIFNQIFIFQSTPGYAPCYSIGGMALKELQELAIKRGKSKIEFNTFAASLGAPPRTIFESKLKKFVG